MKEALDYHKKHPSGKLEIQATKKLDTDWYLSLAYSPGVAEPCKKIHENPKTVFDYTGKGNLVAVISNGSAVLGLGNIGPLAAKPVMEGKAVLFKKFAGINVFDIEIKAKTVEEFVTVCKNLEPTFGGINLEDIASPECFEIERILEEEMDIPVFHDDQHGTAIITAAAFINACYLQNKKIPETKVVFSGAGAAALSCAKLLLHLGVKKENMTLCDSLGIIYKGRTKGMNSYKEEFAIQTAKRNLAEATNKADVFIGLSVKDILTPEILKTMADKAIVFAMANPDPEIHPDLAKKTRPDIIIATGRSDYPNQVNNVLGFPFLFRGALDVQAKYINLEMKLAAVHALAELARKPVPHNVLKAYSSEIFQFGRNYIIPKPFDFRILTSVTPAVAKAAMESKSARKPISNFKDYIQQLETLQSESRAFVREVINRVNIYNSKTKKPTILLPEGENKKILSALNSVLPDKIFEPILMGSEEKIQKTISECNFSNLKKVKILSPQTHPSFKSFAREFHLMKKHKGMSLEEAEKLLSSTNYFANMLLYKNFAQGLLTGASDSFRNSILPSLRIIGSSGRGVIAGVNLVLLKNKVLFFADTAFNIEPTANQLAHIAIYTAQMAQYFQIKPRIALLSFLNFTDKIDQQGSPLKMKKAVDLIKQWKPNLKVEGEIQADIAVNKDLSKELFPKLTFNDSANILIFPNLDSGNMAYKLVQQLGQGEVLGPFLVGIKKPINIIQRTCTIEDIINSLVLTSLKVHAYNKR
ncbi:MAG: NADP-dependent malic enzyme [Bdellovibrionales bacterium]|nr:NADP-dependent malic enzyme [Bdellovibrionales bacterium]